ncbi:MAG: chemotaxis protein CheC [Gemmatimonadales bacterium]
MNDLINLEPRQLDALKEVANIGAGHAATALSQLTDRRIMINVPTITVTDLEQISDVLGNPQEIVAAVLMHMLGDLTGRNLLMMPAANAKLLCDLLLKRSPGATESFDELERSSLKEAGNILGGAYMNALSDFMGMMLLPSVPSLVIDVASAVLTTAHLGFGSERDQMFCVETDFHFDEAERTLTGHFLLLPDPASLKAVLDAVKLS